jgi:hypothetical protein
LTDFFVFVLSINTDEYLCYGWLQKQSGGTFYTNWKSRFCTLDRGLNFKYYTDETKEDLKGQCSMKKTFGFEWDEKEDSKFCIQTSNRKWCFEANNTYQAKMWIEYIIVTRFYDNV